MSAPRGVMDQRFLVPLYRGEWLFLEACAWMRDQGYALIAFENGFSDPKTGRLLQLDGIFQRSKGTT